LEDAFENVLQVLFAIQIPTKEKLYRN